MTRAARADDAAAASFENLGATVIALPLIRIGPAPDEDALRQAAAGADRFAWIVFSSKHGVEAFARARGAGGAGLPRIAAIGAGTARAVEDHLGRHPDVVPHEFVAEALADAIAAAAPVHARVLLIQATDARPALHARLQGAGFNVERVAAYTTVEDPPRDLERYVAGADVIVLASGSAARSLARGLGKDRLAPATRGKLIACIGSVTRDEALRAGLRVAIVPRKASFAAMAEAVARHYAGAT